MNTEFVYPADYLENYAEAMDKEQYLFNICLKHIALSICANAATTGRDLSIDWLGLISVDLQHAKDSVLKEDVVIQQALKHSSSAYDTIRSKSVSDPNLAQDIIGTSIILLLQAANISGKRILDNKIENKKY